MTPPNLDQLQSLINYQFKDLETLETALTHRSCLNLPGVSESYERLEFLGDAVLEMLISVYLFNAHKDKMEGYLTAARSAAVRTEALSLIALKNHFNDFIRMSRGEEVGGGRMNSSILEDVIESLVGAIYVDGGLPAAKDFFDRFILPNAQEIISVNQLKDPKSLLQEKVQSLGMNSPVYNTIKETGLDHKKTFEVQVLVDNKPLASGTGNNKQEAEQKAARQALKLI